MGIIITAVIQSQVYYTLKSSTERQMRAKEVKLEAWFLKQEHARKKFSDQTKKTYGQDSTYVFQAISQYFKFENAYDRSGLTLKNPFFAKLSPEDQNEVTSAIFSSVSDKFNVFFGFFKDENFKKEIFINLKPKLFNPEEVILKRGQEAKGLYFILKGSLILSYKHVNLFRLKEGSFFGESSLVERRCALEHSVSNKVLECLYISQKHFLSICKRYEDVSSILQKIAFERTGHYKECIIKLRKSMQREKLPQSIIIEKSQPGTLAKNINGTILESKIELDVQDIDTQKYIVVSEKELHNQAEEVQNLKINLESCEVPFGSVTKPNQIPNSRIFTNGIITKIEDNLKKLTEETNIIITETTPKYSSNNLHKHPFKKGDHIEVPSLDEADFSDPDPEPSSGIEPATISNIIENLPQKEEESSDQNSGTDSENNSDLNNSLEVPIESIVPAFETPNECDQIVKYIKEKVSANNSRISRLLLSHRDKVLHDWKDMKGVVKNLSTIKEE